MHDIPQPKWSMNKCVQDHFHIIEPTHKLFCVNIFCIVLTLGQPVFFEHCVLF